MTTTRGLTDGTDAFSAVCWALAIVLWGALEALLLYTMAHNSIHAFWSASYWSLSMIVTFPSLGFLVTYREFASALRDAKNESLWKTLSLYLAILLCFTNGTFLVCIASVVNGQY